MPIPGDIRFEVVDASGVCGRVWFLTPEQGKVITFDGSGNPILLELPEAAVVDALDATVTAITAAKAAVLSLADFPAPVSGVITLADNTVYIISGEVNIGTNVIAFGVRSSIAGVNRVNDRIICESTGTAFTSTGSASMVFNEVGLRVPNGTLLSASGTSVAFLNCSIGPCANGGTIALSSAFTFLLRTTSLASAFTVGGFTFTGTTTGLLRMFDSTAANCAGTLLNFGTAIAKIIMVANCVVDVGAGQTFISGTAGTNLTGAGLLSGNILSGAGTAVSGIAGTDAPWVFSDNIGVTNTPVSAAGSTLTDTVPVAKGGTGMTAVGTALQVLRTNAGATGLEFATFAGGGDLLAANNLSDLVSAAAARTNLGLGTAATTASTAYATAAQGVTADLAAVASTTTAALALKAPLAAPTFTGTLNAATITATGNVTGLNLSGTNTGDQTNVTGNAGTVTTNANLTGPVTSTGNATAIANGAITNAMLANGAVANLSGANTGDNAVNSNYSGLVSNAAHTGDATGATALTVVAINGTSLAGLATGILKNTTTTGVPSIAVAGDFPILNQSTTGSAATLTTSRNINGVAFNGSANITVTAAADTLTTATLASGVLASSLTSVGTLTGGATGAGFTIALTTSTVTGTLPDARFPATLPALSGVNLTALNATNLGSGTVPDARFPATLPAASGVNLTALNGSNVATGTVADARIATPLTGKTLTTSIVNNQSLINNFSTASQAPVAATRTYITGSRIIVPVGKLQIGTMLRWTFDLTKTAAGIAASTFDICFGTAGTTADTARVSFTKPAGTGVVDTGRVTIDCIIRGPLSASGIAVGQFNLTHNLSTTGLANLPCINVTTVSGAFDVTVANLSVGVCITTGASDAYTIQLVRAEALNL